MSRMRIDTMRRIDRVLGVPLCALLSFWDRIRRLVRRPPQGPPSRILFIELSEMGSMVLAFPLFEKVRRDFPGAELYFLTFRRNRYAVDVLKAIPEANVVTIEDGSLPRFALTALGAIRRLRRLRPDTTVDLELFARVTAVLGYLSGARRRVGFHRFHNEGLYRGGFLTHRVALNPHIHIAHNLLNLGHALTEPRDQVPFAKVPVDPEVIRLPRFSPGADVRDRVKARLESACPGIEGARRIILLNPNAGDLVPLRRWPESHYLELGRRLLRTPDLYLVLTGTSDEAAAAERIRASLDPLKVCNFAGRTTFEELLTLYTLADILITNDSGPAHFSSMTSIRSFVLFGPETPALYGPLGENSRAFHAGYGCSPCVSAFNHRRSPCRDNLCLQAITPGEVYEEIQCAAD